MYNTFAVNETFLNSKRDRNCNNKACMISGKGILIRRRKSIPGEDDVLRLMHPR